MDDNTFKEYAEIGFQVDHREAVLESWLELNPDKIIDTGSLLMIGRQVVTDFGAFIDLLAVDKKGDLVIIELKRDRTPRETMAQAIEYASFAEKIKPEQLDEIFLSYIGDERVSLAEYHRQYFNSAADETVVFNSDQMIVIVGQHITPEIKQSAQFLQKKGLRVVCQEFKFFKAEGGLRLLSTNIVVGAEANVISQVTSGSLPRTTETGFLQMLDENGHLVFERILDFAKENSHPLHWGEKGFSLNVNLSGNHVPVCYGYPPHSVYKQSIYTSFGGSGGLFSKIELSEYDLNDLITDALDSGLFQRAGSGKEVKCLVSRRFTDAELSWLISWLRKMTLMVDKYGLKGQTDPGESNSYETGEVA
jgi:hypothetical protein